jgi:hypothetical protein
MESTWNHSKFGMGTLRNSCSRTPYSAVQATKGSEFKCMRVMIIQFAWECYYFRRRASIRSINCSPKVSPSSTTSRRNGRVLSNRTTTSSSIYCSTIHLIITIKYLQRLAACTWTQYPDADPVIRRPERSEAEGGCGGRRPYEVPNQGTAIDWI